YCVVFFNHTAATGLYTLSLHDALPISGGEGDGRDAAVEPRIRDPGRVLRVDRGDAEAPLRERERQRQAGKAAAHDQNIAFMNHLDRKSTRLNSSHVKISYAVFCLKKKK